MQAIKKKPVSTGVIALAYMLAKKKYKAYILCGFSFELTHSYAFNEQIISRKGTKSPHAESDITVLSYLSNKYKNIKAVLV